MSVVGFESIAGKRYIPSWQELAVSVALVATGVFVFSLMLKFLPIFPEEEFEAEEAANAEP